MNTSIEIPESLEGKAEFIEQLRIFIRHKVKEGGVFFVGAHPQGVSLIIERCNDLSVIGNQLYLYGARIIGDHHCPYNTVYLIDLPYAKLAGQPAIKTPLEVYGACPYHMGHGARLNVVVAEWEKRLLVREKLLERAMCCLRLTSYADMAKEIEEHLK